MKNKSIVNRIFIIVFLSAIFVGLISSMLISTTMLRSFFDENTHKNQIYVDRLKEVFEQDLYAIESTVNSVANTLHTKDFKALGNTPGALDDFEKEYSKYFESILLEDLKYSNSLYVYLNPELDGDVHDVWMTREAAGFTIRHDEVPLERFINNDNMTWFYVPRDLGYSLWLKPYTNRYDQLVSSFIVPIFQDDTYVGMVGMYLSFEDLQEKMRHNSIYDGDFFWILNEDGDIIHQAAHLELNDETLTDYSVFSSTLHNGWTLKYSVPKKEINKVYNRLMAIAGLITLGFAVVWLIISILARNKYSAIFSEIISSIQALEKGNYSNKIKTSYDGELGEIATALNKSADKILELNKEMRILAFQNPITGLCNRNKLIKNLENCSETSVFFLLDIDNFKTINEILGRETGDAILRSTAESLLELRNDKVHIYHTSGDEFTIQVSYELTKIEIEAFAEDILKKIVSVHEKDDLSFVSTASIGIAKYPDDADNFNDLSKYLEVALYKAKENGKNTYVLYEKILYNEVLVTSTLESNLRSALKNKEMKVYYQPIIQIKSNKVVGLEALVRWNHPTKGLLLPHSFIQLAEKSGEIIKIGKYVLEQALTDTNALSNQHGTPLKLSINLTFKQLMDPNLLDDLKSLLSESKFPYDRLSIELAESTINGNRLEALKVINQIKSLGINITIDKFGTGHSTLNTLIDTSIDTIKISRQTVSRLSSDESSQVLLKTIVDIARNMDIEAAAVGVETSDVLNNLINLGFTSVQGYYYSEALSVEELSHFILNYNVSKK